MWHGRKMSCKWIVTILLNMWYKSLQLVTWDFCITCDIQNPILTFPTHSIFTVNLASKFKLTRINITISPFIQTLTNEEIMYKFRTYHQYPHNLLCTFRLGMHLYRCWKLTMKHHQSTKSTQYNNVQLLGGCKQHN